MDVPIDPSVIPWSYRGSYLCLATRSGQNGRLTTGHDVCLVSHRHPAGLPLFAIRPVTGACPSSRPSGFPTTPSPARYEAQPSNLRWLVDGKIVAEAAYENVRAVRFRGTAPLSFDTQGSLDVEQWRCWLWRVPPTKDGSQEVEFTATPNTNLRFIVTRGTVSLENDAPYDFNFKDNNRRLTVRPREGDTTWELSVMERDSEPSDGPAATQERSFDECVRDVQGVFEAYARKMCPWQDATKADHLAAYVMWTSTVRPAGFITSEAVLMSKLWMNKLWSWDNCINGLALVQYDLELALAQILLPFAHVTPEGRLPDSMTCSEILYDYTKPPIYGWTFYKLLELLDSSSTISQPMFGLLPRPRLEEIYDSVGRFTRYWFDHRSTSTSALPYYSHGNDSGWDNSTAYDHQTVCISPDLAGFLVLQCDLLAKLGTHLSAPGGAEWAKLRDRTIGALVSELWDESAQAFAFKDAYDGRTWTTSTLLQFMPLVAAPFLPARIVRACVTKLEPYLSEWGLATERLDSKHDEPDGYWRGPIWAPPTLILESAIRGAGFSDVADKIAARYIRLCERGGFAENYNALTGEGNRDLSYTWSASAYLAMRFEMERRRG